MLRGFAIALIWGIVIGTYSSICIAAAGLLNLRHSKIRGDDEGAQEAGKGAARGRLGLHTERAGRREAWTSRR